MAGARQTPGFEITGLPEMEARLNAAMVEMGVGGKEAVTVVAHEVINEAKQFCPVDTGRLRSSLGGGPDGVASDGVKDDTDSRGPAVIVGTHVDYAAFVEFGTRNHGVAQPYLRPALEMARAHMMGEMATVIRHAVPGLP